MAICANCGRAIEGRFCTNCGGMAAAGSGQMTAGAAPAPAASTGGLSENAAGALSYLLGFITGVLFLVLSPYNTNPRVRFHAFQAIFFHLSFFALAIVLVVVTTFMPLLLDLALTGVSMLISLGGFVLWLFLMFRAYQGEPLVLPVIGNLARQQAERV